MADSKELQLISKKVNRNPSKKLLEARKVLKQQNINPEHAMEFFLNESEVEEIKQCVRKETKNNCYFFWNPAEESEHKGKVHLVTFYNISGMAEYMESLKSGESKAIIKQTSNKVFDFSQNVSFGAPKQQKHEESKSPKIKESGTPSSKERIKDFIANLPKEQQGIAIKAFKTLKDSNEPKEKVESKSYLQKIGFKF